MVAYEPTANRQRALVTGASAGIGAAFAARLARDGYQLILVARDSKRLADVARRLEASHDTQIDMVIADLARAEDVLNLEQRIAEGPALDLLINNAGFGTPGAFIEIAPDDTERMIRVHVVALVRLTHAALPAMVACGRGAIINVSSLGAFTFSSPTYDATKAYVNVFTESVQREVARTGVRLQALCPGFTRTAFHTSMGVDPRQDWGVLDSWWMTPEDIVDAALVGLDQREVVCIPGLDDPMLLTDIYNAQDRLVQRAVAAGFPASRYRASTKKAGESGDR